MQDAMTAMTVIEVLDKALEPVVEGKEVGDRSALELVNVTVTGPAVFVTTAAGGGVTEAVMGAADGVVVGGRETVGEVEEVEVEEVVFALVRDVVLVVDVDELVVVFVPVVEVVVPVDVDVVLVVDVVDPEVVVDVVVSLSGSGAAPITGESASFS